MIIAPPADRLPIYPASWYLFCRTRDLRGGPLSRNVLGRRLVAFHKTGGKVAVLDARCAHLGADLGAGCVVEDQLECPFHHWRYNGEGRCVHIPASPDVPEFALVRAYPAVERHGHVFFFNGAQPLFPLPFFDDANPDQYVSGRPLHFDADCPWHLVNGNSFDIQHFRASHGRELLGEPVVDCPQPFARRIRLMFQVAGDSIFDRLLRRFVGDRVEVSMTNWGGTMVVVTGDFGRACSTLITCIEPLNERTCRQNVLVYSRQSRFGSPINAACLFVRRLFTHGFMAGEYQTLAGIRYVPDRFLSCDRLMVDYFHWVAGLPQVAPTDRPDPVLPRFESVSR